MGTTLSNLKLLSGTANPELAQEIADYIGVKLTEVKIKPFADGEIYEQIKESVRGADCYVIQPTCNPVNDNLMELLIMTDALRRASAKSIAAVMPYFGYARQDRKAAPREPITAKLVANLIHAAGATRAVTLDLHAPQIMGYFNDQEVVDHLYARPVLVKYFKELGLSNPVVVSPDVGGAKRARELAERIGAPIALIDKRRKEHNAVDSMVLVGDVKGKTAIMIDDIIDTAGTIVKGAKLLKDEGAEEVYACCSHAVLSQGAMENLFMSPIKKLITTNSIPAKESDFPFEIERLSLAPLLGEAIKRIHCDGSVSELFE